ncbi:MAG TPA: hypothetical protein IAA29_17820 [Candidatus Paenibacillus intestinavium]|nr:hypothetical protein [Candidatus Paenibacillus intestinavium]
MSLFNPDDDKKMALEKVTYTLKYRYGDTSIIRAVSVTAAGQALRRAEMIGGHYKSVKKLEENGLWETRMILPEHKESILQKAHEQKRRKYECEIVYLMGGMM